VLAVQRYSKKKPAFGNTSSQRLLPFSCQATPGPGTYDWDSGKQKHVSDAGSAFRSESRRLEAEQTLGDPGAYDADQMTSLAATSSQTFNKTSKPFGATGKRELNVNIYGADTPGPGRYEPKRPEAQTTIEGVFSSGSTQRPAADTHKVPGSGTYDPDVGAVKPVVKNAGASMNGFFDRFKPEASATEDTGPGAYSDEKAKSLAEDSVLAVQRYSKKKPAFGNTSSQRLLPFSCQATPGPGAYEPMSPRIKDELFDRISLVGAGGTPTKLSKGNFGSPSKGAKKRAKSAPKTRPK